MSAGVIEAEREFVAGIRAGARRFVEIRNHTARRIRIKKAKASDLILPPFGAYKMPEHHAGALRAELDLWIERGYVSERLVGASSAAPSAYEPTAVPAAAALLGASWFAQVQFGGWLMPAVGIALALALFATEVRKLVRQSQSSDLLLDQLQAFADWMRRGLGMLFVAAVGYGLPFLALFLHTGSSISEIQNAVFTGQHLRSLAFVALFALFVGTAATLPAFLFFVFSEQCKETAKSQFLRDVLRLDPSLRTLGEAERTYAPLLSDVFDVRRGALFFAPFVLSTFLLALGWTIVALPPIGVLVPQLRNDTVELSHLFAPVGDAFKFAFLGTYFFSVNMVFRRYVRADLGPKAFSHIAVRIMVASILSWVAGLAFTSAIDVGLTPSGQQGSTPAALLAFAFLVGIVPETGLAVLQDLVKNRFVGLVVPTLLDKDPLSRLEGVTLYDRARLLEEGIENVENLAHHNLIQLVLRTRIPAPRLIDLIDQAVLYLHARGTLSGAPPEAGSSQAPTEVLELLRAYGIRTATDLEETVRAGSIAPGPGVVPAPEPADKTPRWSRDSLLNLVGKSDSGVPRLAVILAAVEDDEWMPQLRSWRGFRRTYERAYDLHEFESPP
jgi:hypothetical protein